MCSNVNAMTVLVETQAEDMRKKLKPQFSDLYWAVYPFLKNVLDDLMTKLATSTSCLRAFIDDTGNRKDADSALFDFKCLVDLWTNLKMSVDIGSIISSWKSMLKRTEHQVYVLKQGSWSHSKWVYTRGPQLQISKHNVTK